MTWLYKQRRSIPFSKSFHDTAQLHQQRLIFKYEQMKIHTDYTTVPLKYKEPLRTYKAQTNSGISS